MLLFVSLFRIQKHTVVANMALNHCMKKVMFSNSKTKHQSRAHDLADLDGCAFG